MNNESEWIAARNELLAEMVSRGYPEELGLMIARHLGSPKAIHRMSAYLRQAKPQSAEEIVDEMLAIRSEIDAWKQRKQSQEANARINEILNDGL